MEVFAFNENLLLLNGQESNFEISQAAKYCLVAPDERMKTTTYLFWKFGENTFPEMELAIRKAKSDYGHLWPNQCSEGYVAELIFQLIALQKENEDLIFDNRNLKEENTCLRSRLSEIGKTVLNIPESSIINVPEVTMSTVCDETMSTPDNPVLGLSTILSCAEKKVLIDNGPTPTLTINVRRKIDEIIHMFCEGDSEQQQTMDMDVRSPVSLPAPLPAPLQIHKDNAAPVLKTTLPPPRHNVGGLQVLKDDPVDLPQLPHAKSKGLKIYMDPEAIGHQKVGDEKVSRPPVVRPPQEAMPYRPPRASSPALLPPRHLLPSAASAAVESGQESMVAAPGDGVSTFTLPFVFNPSCASTAVFPRPEAAVPGANLPPRGPREGSNGHPDQADEMKVSSSPPAPAKPHNPLVDVFNQFVHSPGPGGRLRIDATQFMDAFLSKKPPQSQGPENKRPHFF